MGKVDAGLAFFVSVVCWFTAYAVGATAMALVANGVHGIILTLGMLLPCFAILYFWLRVDKEAD